jgi:hypothetical protein
MELNEQQKAQVAKWIQDGVKLAEVQKRLDAEFGLRLTYMETSLLMDDLHLVPKSEPEAAPPAEKPAAQETAETATGEKAPAGTGQVSVSVDQVARPGAVISGKVSFSDGQNAMWTLDQLGRLGLATDVPGYKPSAEDLSEFQLALQQQLQKMGF